MTRNPVHLTAPAGRGCQSKEQALHDWHSGKPWRVYRGDGMDCTCNDALRFSMAGFTHVVLVWQDADMRVHGHEIELRGGH